MSEPNILPSPSVELPDPTDHVWLRERQAFRHMLSDLLKTHRGQYVAIHKGQVAESGDDLASVALRAYRKHGYVPMYVDIVTEQPLPPVRVPSPRRIVSETSP